MSANPYIINFSLLAGVLVFGGLVWCWSRRFRSRFITRNLGSKEPLEVASTELAVSAPAELVFAFISDWPNIQIILDGGLNREVNSVDCHTGGPKTGIGAIYTRLTNNRSGTTTTTTVTCTEYNPSTLIVYSINWKVTPALSTIHDNNGLLSAIHDNNGALLVFVIRLSNAGCMLQYKKTLNVWSKIHARTRVRMKATVDMMTMRLKCAIEQSAMQPNMQPGMAMQPRLAMQQATMIPQVAPSDPPQASASSGSGFCTSCGAQRPEGIKFCGQCGSTCI